VATSCTFAYNVDGVDNGNLTIAGPETCAPSGCQLTINAGQTIVWNPGKSVYVNGSIWINKPGGQLKKTYLWMIDVDADNWPATTTQYYGDSAPNYGRRRYLMATTTVADCFDAIYTAAGYVYQNIDNLAEDKDHDKYIIGTAATRCVGEATSTYWYKDVDETYKWIATGNSLGTDCCDSDANAKPGQISYFPAPNACGSWDYDCNNATTTDPSTCTGGDSSASCSFSSYVTCDIFDPETQDCITTAANYPQNCSLSTVTKTCGTAWTRYTCSYTGRCGSTRCGYTYYYVCSPGSVTCGCK
jgi:hypothetical protein